MYIPFNPGDKVRLIEVDKHYDGIHRHILLEGTATVKRYDSGDHTINVEFDSNGFVRWSNAACWELVEPAFVPNKGKVLDVTDTYDNVITTSSWGDGTASIRVTKEGKPVSYFCLTPAQLREIADNVDELYRTLYE